jgi:hypothetical protein
VVGWAKPMPLSSMEIAQMNGAFQGAAMQQQQYSGMIGQGYGGGIYGGSGAMGDRLMGGAMSRMGAVGAPVMTGAAALMGMDAMSLGLKAGVGAYGAGMGFGGAAMAAGAVALPAMAGFGAASYAGQQAFQGAGQQMDLNQTLRQSYNFRNTQGGSGFQRNEMTSIGSMIRDMSGQFGPGGEVVGFRELTQLAGKMNTMGLAQGVKDVKDFSEKFKHMVTSLKQMATDLGTTLEGAMEFAASAKQSGVFGMNRQQAFTSAARHTAVSGGLAVSEVTGAASIGSQISRSMGGLGRQGAIAGMRTIGQIGTAVQMGAISEEDIYNVTGLTGAEGRQAYATSSMQKTASFLQSGRGRRLLASMAGKDGTLDESAVQEFLSGGMSIQETMRLDNKMKSTVGRANFIRNEGRLRGAAMERLGAFLPGIQMQQWAASKGIDINDMDDRSMLFAQRQLGMGRDEVDTAIKMANAMPRILEEQRRSDAHDQSQQQFGLMMKGKGIEGVKTRYNQAKEEINNKLQKVGQDLFNSGSEWVEGMMNKLIDNYTQTANADIDNAFQDMMGGGAIGKGAAAKVFGIGGGKGFTRGALPGLGGFQGRSLAERMNQGTAGGMMDSLKASLLGGPEDVIKNGGGIGEYLRHGQSGVGRMAEAGFNMRGMSSEQMSAKFREIDKLQGIASESAANGMNLGSDKDSDWIRFSYAMGKMPKGGDERIAGFGKQLAANNPQEAAKWEKMSQAEKVAYMATKEARAGITGGGALASRYGVPKDMEGTIQGLHGKGFATAGEENIAYAKAFGYESGTGYENQSNLFGLDKGIANLVHGNAATRFEEAGAYIKSKDFRDLAEKIFSDDTDVGTKARAELGQRLGSIGPGEATSADAVQRDMLAASKYDALKRSGAPQSEIDKVVADSGMSIEQLEKKAAGARSVVGDAWARNVSAVATTQGALGRQEMKDRGRMGLFQGGALSGVTRDELMKGGGSGAVGLAMSGERMAQLKASLQGGEQNADSDANILQKMQQETETQKALMHNMTVPQMRAVAASLAGTPEGSVAGREAAMETKVGAGFKSRRGGAAKTVAGILGVDVKGDLSTREAADKWAEQAIQQLGVKDDGTIQQIHQAVSAARRGDVKGTSENLRSVVESSDFSEAKKKKSMDEAESRDPLQAAIKKNTEDMATHLGALVNGQKRINVFVENAKDIGPQEDGEKNKPQGSDKNSAKSGR